MPGSSLWLVPPPDHPVHRILTKLITQTLPNTFPDVAGSDCPSFSPHMTLTSNIDPALYGDDPQGWLDGVPWPQGRDVSVRFAAVQTQDVYFRRCFVQVGMGDGVADIAALARARGVEGEADQTGPKTRKWLGEWAEAFGPHVSLIYGDNPIDDAKLQEISKVVKEAGIELEGPGWEGGVVWLVPTDRPINEWKPIATKEL
ncbi:2',3'-cyclic-nucleotide 3'-phosphodiesterase [Pestalotiopsis fici W106-1]|uniref:2',3'-cyclic-nucleotide 3'-phosphodiesterase n=1 Tax=Pestalotiopsis fici (strain W106-1 / CGMCC3.15140) TaxID=1229662 RepID=W3WY89_PESFW|nr:2',3'-cyclic-nucleotide 3'-phosphodiesterase [Pestalotiopsis fici W106-1]ETS78729.1 2',3'-cyclic-nucleotide 3'-phosphodiesterase [Pestalotiopsis fici W106-1]